MKAHELVDKYGGDLVGATVMTQPLGEWPGGVCEVIEVLPDINAPEIVYQVRDSRGEEIGVFADEYTFLLEHDGEPWKDEAPGE